MTRRGVAEWIFGGLLMATASLTWGLGFDGKDLNGLACQGKGQGYGPYDYTNPAHVKHKLPVVENYHFTPEVRRLRRGKSGSLFSDLDYVLRAFPNHHKAMYALIRLVTEPPRAGANIGQVTTPPECYLQRALRFKPKDGNVHLLYGLYLHKLGKLEEAEPHYRTAVKLMPRSAEANYDLGVLLVDLKRYADAVPLAKAAYRYGYPLSGLRRRLAAAGHPIDSK